MHNQNWTLQRKTIANFLQATQQSTNYNYCKKWYFNTLFMCNSFRNSWMQVQMMPMRGFILYATSNTTLLITIISLSLSSLIIIAWPQNKLHYCSIRSPVENWSMNSGQPFNFEHFRLLWLNWTIINFNRLLQVTPSNFIEMQCAMKIKVKAIVWHTNIQIQSYVSRSCVFSHTGFRTLNRCIEVIIRSLRFKEHQSRKHILISLQCSPFFRILFLNDNV